MSPYRMVSVSAAICLLAGCGPSVKGTWCLEGDATRLQLLERDAILTGAGETRTAKYVFDGKQVFLTPDDKTSVEPMSVTLDGKLIVKEGSRTLTFARCQ